MGKTDPSSSTGVLQGCGVSAHGVCSFVLTATGAIQKQGRK